MFWLVDRSYDAGELRRFGIALFANVRAAFCIDEVRYLEARRDGCDRKFSVHAKKASDTLARLGPGLNRRPTLHLGNHVHYCHFGRVRPTDAIGIELELRALWAVRVIRRKIPRAS